MSCVSFYENRINMQILLCNRGLFDSELIRYLIDKAEYSSFKYDFLDNIVPRREFGSFSPEMIFNQTEEKTKSSLIPEDSLKWVDSPLAIAFLTNVMNSLNNEYYSKTNPSLLFFNSPIDILYVANGAMSFKSLVFMVDNLSVKIGRQKIEEIIYTLKSQWTALTKSFPSPFWFSANKQNIKEMDSYNWLLSRFDKMGVIEDNIDYHKKSENQFIIYSVFYSWASNKTMSEVELFLIKTRKSWSQRKFKKSVKDKKVLNTYISGDAKDQLKKLAKNSNRNMNEELEVIINDAYLRRLM
ncbi:hypothetical protein ACIPUG_05815 [Pectobacterium sp. CHL-2024]|uniref:hypothetical protein n=1 Tax=Pectobacterium sp. CHL-2024 TaxID=3377079 RepID=UPI00382CDA37